MCIADILTPLNLQNMKRDRSCNLVGYKNDRGTGTKFSWVVIRRKDLQKSRSSDSSPIPEHFFELAQALFGWSASLYTNQVIDPETSDLIGGAKQIIREVEDTTTDDEAPAVIVEKVRKGRELVTLSHLQDNTYYDLVVEVSHFTWSVKCVGQY